MDDIVEANLIALNRGGGGVYNLGRGIEVSDLEIFATVRAAVGVDVTPVFAPVRPGEVEHIALDASKAEQELGWRWKVGLTEGVRPPWLITRNDQEDGPVTKKERRDPERQEDGRDEARENQPEQEHKPRSDQELQEGDSLTALKAILAKVAALLKPLRLTPEEAIRLVEQLYGRVLEMDVRLAGEADDTRKSPVLTDIQETVVRRDGDGLVVEFPQD